MKRTFALLLTALLAVSITACGYTNGNVKSTTPNKSVTGTGTTTGTGVTKNNGATKSTGVTKSNGASGTAAKTAGDSILSGDNNGLGASKSVVVKNGANATTDTTTTTTKNGTNGSVIRGATYGQMLRNARVHDKDGFLLDGENAVTPGAAYR